MKKHFKFITFFLVVCFCVLFYTIPAKAKGYQTISDARFVSDKWDYSNYKGSYYEIDGIRGNLIEYGTCGKKELLTLDQFGPDKYETVPKYAYAMYHFIVSAPYTSDALGYLYKGDSHTITFSKCTEKTIEKSLSDTLTSGFSLGLSLGIQASDILNIGVSTKSDVKNATTFGKKTTTKVSNSYSWSTTSYIQESGTYYAQRRALFDAYIIQIFDIHYSSYCYQTKKVGLYNNKYYRNELQYYTLNEVNTNYIPRTDLGFCLARYEFDDNGNRKYASPIISSNYLYF